MRVGRSERFGEMRRWERMTLRRKKEVSERECECDLPEGHY